MRRKTVIPKMLPKPQGSSSAEREYYRALRIYVDRYVKLMREGLNEIVPDLKDQAAEELPAIRTDNWHPYSLTTYLTIRMDANIEKMIKKLFDRVGVDLDNAFTEFMLKKWARSMVTHVNEIGKKNAVKVAKSAELEIEPLMRDGDLTPYFDNIVDENVGLIKSIPRSRLDFFKNKLVAAITRDDPQDRIRKMIQDHFDATYNQARLIARDQTNKLNGAVNQYRQQQLGGKRYTWRTVHDSRVREDHEKLDGKIFYWSSPPIVDQRTKRRGHPGYDFQCRCYAEAILEDILE